MRLSAACLAFAAAPSLALAQPFQSQGMELLSWIDLPTFGVAGGNGNSCWGYVSPAGREYAIMGLNNRVAFVDITAPTAPVIVATVAHTNSLWADVKTHGRYCYVSNESGGGLQVIDMANIDSGSVTLVRSVTTNGMNTSHTIAVDNVSGFLYACGSSVTGAAGGPVAWNLADPSNPTFAGMWSGHYTHECQAVTYTSGPYAGRQIVFACNENTGVAIIDATNKASMTTMSITPYTGVRYCHQAWLSEDRRYLYINDELDGPAYGVLDTWTRIMDVTNLSAPVNVGAFTSGTPNSTDHNLYVRGNRIYESNYHSGLRVFDAASPLAPTEIASFDTYPENDASGFDGLWNNYPFFPSQNIVLSDIDRGMFVVRVMQNFLIFSFPTALPTQLPVNTPTPVTVEVRAVGAPVDTGSVVLHARLNSGAFTDIPMAPIGQNRYQASLPAAACFDVASWYFTAANTSATTFTSPSGAPAALYSASAVPPLVTTLPYDMETDAGWVGGQAGDTATTGLWQRGDPEPTTAQPGDDHTASPGVGCWITGRLAGASDGANDVDGGFTTLRSPTLNLADANADTRIGYWRWYSNSQGGSPNADTFRVDISNNAGSTWVNAETVGPAGAETSGGWFFHDFRVADIVPLTAAIVVRFVADDAGAGSLIEAAVDDFAVFTYECPPACDPDVNQDGNTDQDDVAYLINVISGGPNPTGIDPDFNRDGNTDQDDVSMIINVIAGAPCN